MSRAWMLVVAACAWATCCGTAAASCTMSTPSTASFPDAPADGEAGLAPEITTVTVSLDATCGYAIDPGISDLLIEGSAVFEYVDVDGNAATGSPVFAGADIAVGSLGVTGADPAPVLGRYDAAAGNFTFTGTALTPVGSGGFRASLDQLGVAAPTTTRIYVGALWNGIYDSYSDFAPDPGQAPFPFAVAFGTGVAAPVVPAPVSPGPPPSPSAPSPGDPAASSPVSGPGTEAPAGCKVPRVARMSRGGAVHILRSAGCRIGLTRRAYSPRVARGRVIRTLPRAGLRWSRPVTLVVSRGRRPRGARARSAAMVDVARSLEDASATLAARLAG